MRHKYPTSKRIEYMEKRYSLIKSNSNIDDLKEIIDVFSSASSSIKIKNVDYGKVLDTDEKKFLAGLNAVEKKLGLEQTTIEKIEGLVGKL